MKRKDSRLESFKRSGHFDLDVWLFGFFLVRKREDGKDVEERQRTMRWNVTWGRVAERRGTDLKRMTSRSEAPNVWQSVPDAALGVGSLARSLVYFLLLLFLGEIRDWRVILHNACIILSNE